MRDLSDDQWDILKAVFIERRRPDGKGRPWQDARAVLNGVLWILRTGHGRICQTAIRPIRLAIAASSSGSEMAGLR